jgi:hypothetical protein
MLPGGTDDEPGSGAYSLELQHGNGSPLFVRYFELAGIQKQSGHFAEILPYHPETAQIILKHDDIVLDTIVVSLNTPQVTVTYPNGGESFTGEQIITWTATDADGDTLTYDVLYSKDGGFTWSAIVVRLNQNSYKWNTMNTAGSNQALIKVLATDGVNTGQDISDSSFTIPKKSPEPAIISPEDGSSFFLNKMIIFEGNGLDLEDGPLAGNSLSWSSNRDGMLGSGRDVSSDNLSPGEHTITLTAQDSDGNSVTESITITISSIQDTDGDRIGDDVDNCPLIYNPDQVNVDGDEMGDVCDEDDSDSDGYLDNTDNCDSIPNDQKDIDNDAVGDVCDNCPNDSDNDADKDGLCADVDPCPSVAGEINFIDISDSHWANEYISAIACNGIAAGYEDSTYRPDNNVTRDQMAVYIIRALEGDPFVDYCGDVDPFTDVLSTHWACGHIKRLSRRGISTGFEDGSYKPASVVNRAQMAVYIIRALEGDPSADYCGGIDPFTDVPSTHWACGHIKRLSELGISTGYPDGSYRSTETVNRAQMAVYIARALLGVL